MPRTASFYQQDSAPTDLKLFLAPTDFALVSGSDALTVNAKGDVSRNIGASATNVYSLMLGKLLERTGFPLFLQEQFGTAAGVAGPSSVANTSDPAANKGYPPFTGASQLVPRTGNIPKGIQINDLTVVYQITGAALTTHTIGLSKTVFPKPGTPGALVVTDVIAPGANGLTTAVVANPQSVKVAVASPFMNVTDLSGLITAYAVTTAAGGSFKLYGAFAHCSFNFN